MLNRRQILKTSVGLAAASLLPSATAHAQAAQKEATVGKGPYPAQAYGASNAKSPLGPLQIERRTLGSHDVLLDILYCGVCHSDIHVVRSEWGPSEYPVVPGHEIIGRVQAVGSAVTKFKVGDIGGVGCMVDSCGTCAHCVADLKQYCEKGNTQTYGSPDKISGGHTLGGYSDKVVVTEKFVIRIPPGADLAATAPLLCAGVTTFSPMQHWSLKPGQRVGIVGLGGLGHVAVKLAVARNADVTVFTTSPQKAADAKKMGAKEVVVSTTSQAMKEHAGKYDLLISTVSQPYPMGPFIELLKLDGTLVNVGAMEPLEGVHGMTLGHNRRSLVGSVIGGIAETQEVIDYCTSRGIKADIELIKPDQINRAYERIMDKDVRYRFVIDMTSLKTEKTV